MGLRIFVSYAAEQERTAEELKHLLEQSGHSAFVAGADVRASDQYESIIRRQLRRAQVFIFLASANSTAPGNYSLSEVRIASERGHKLHRFAVAFDDVDLERIPTWLSSVSVLRPQGNLAAEVVHRVDGLASDSRRRASRRLVGGGGAIIVVSAVLYGLYGSGDGTSVTTPVRPPESAGPIYRQEVSSRSFSVRISSSNGQEQPTTVHGYLDFDASSAQREDADLMVRVRFFDNEGGSMMRASSSDIVGTDASGHCEPVPRDPEGSALIAIRPDRTYCLRTNQGRLSRFQILRIGTSWGANAEIDVRYSFETFAIPE